MAPKRPADAAQQSGAQKKRMRMREQRQIPVQGAQPRAGGSAAYGTGGLPPTIEVEKFAQARSFEIMAMQRAMKSAKAAGTQRAFQSLPRHLRRRAASHNIRRLPARLRVKALSETPKDAAKPKKKTRKMMGRKRFKTLKETRAEILLKRQRKKIWLETHIWHAKRMHMTEIWGHRIAEKPTEKAFRASYRASFHGALVHDASYYQYLELIGPEAKLSSLLREVCDPSDVSPGSKRHTSGARECYTHLYKPSGDGMRDLIGPATIIWDTPITPLPPPNDALFYGRTVLVRLHPSICASAYEAFDAVETNLFCGVRRCEKEFITIEVTGRRATEVVKAVLKPVLASSPATKEAWRKLSSTAGPGSVPKGMIIGLEVYDPRLSFPPKLDKSTHDVNSSSLLQPTSEIAQALPFWDQAARLKIRTPRFKKSELDARRSNLLIPGSSLPAIEQDDRISLLLSQRTLSPPVHPPSGSRQSSHPTNNSDEVSGWTLTIPAGWGTAFWSSLVFSETRVGGLRERSQSFFEAGAPRFPEDYPGTSAFDEYETRREAEDRSYYDRRPPAKRPNFVKLGTPSPFRANFLSILNTWAQRRCEESRWRGDESWDQVPWLVSPLVAALVLEHRREKAKLVPGGRASEIAVALLESFNDALIVTRSKSTKVATPGLLGALVRVRVTPCGRGAPEELGVIYFLEDAQWREVEEKVRVMKGRKVAVPTEEKEGHESLCAPPSSSAIMGRVTTGNFSLKRGRGYAVGAIPLHLLLQMIDRDNSPRPGTSKPAAPCLALVRNRDGEVFRAVSLELMT